MGGQNNLPDIFSDYVPGDHREDPDLEIALVLQDGQPGDAHILKLLIEQYADEVFRLVRAFASGEGGDAPHSEICIMVEKVFVTACLEVDRFWGKSSVRNWLFTITAEQLMNKARGWGNKSPVQTPVWRSWEDLFAPQTLEDEEEAFYLAEIANLPERQRLAVLLRFAQGLSLADTAEILGDRPERLAAKFASLMESILHRRTGSPTIGRHGRIRRLIEIALGEFAPWPSPPAEFMGIGQSDATIREVNSHKDDNSTPERSAARLESHLSECEDCRIYCGERRRLGKWLAETLQKRWPETTFSPNQLQELAAAAGLLIGHLPGRKVLPIRQAIWVTGFFALSIVLFFLFNKIDLEPLPPPEQAIVSQPNIPTPLAAAAGMETIVESAFSDGVTPRFRRFAEVVMLANLDGIVTSLVYSPGTRLMAAGTQDGAIQLLSIDGNLVTRINTATKSTITSLAFSPGGEWLAAGAANGEVIVWRQGWEDGRFYKFSRHPRTILQVRFLDADGKLLVASDQAMWIWHRMDKNYVRVGFHTYTTGFIRGMTVTRDGQLAILATKDGTIWLQEIVSGEVVLRLAGQQAEPSHLALSGDGSLLAVGGNSGLIEVWQLAGGAEVEGPGKSSPSVTGHKTLEVDFPVAGMSFSPDGSRLVLSSMEDGGLRFIDLQSGAITGLPYPKKGADRWLTGVFTQIGGSVAAVSRQSSIYLWQEVDNVIKPIFFNPLQGDDLPSAFVKGGTPESRLLVFPHRNWDPPDTLYQAADEASFPVHAPTDLPAGFIFEGVYRIEKDLLRVYYRFASPEAGEMDLFFLQRAQPFTSGWRPVGENAIVERTRVTGRYAEFVRGDWVFSPVITGNEGMFGQFDWSWSNDLPAATLIWRKNNISFAIYARASSSMDLFNLKGTLLDLAESMTPVGGLSSSIPILFEYTVSAGDTCTDIALEFGTTVSDLVLHNDVPADCNLIRIGQKLLVPLNEERIPLVETDLDCDGGVERLQLIPASPIQGEAFIQGFVVETLAENGLYREAWRYTMAENGGFLLEKPDLVPSETCEQLVSVRIAGTGETGQLFFRWDGKEMKLAGQADGGSNLNAAIGDQAPPIFKLESHINPTASKTR
jgi:WD40 repeat protein/DNA-directed RNA polymerase specialized sigma24 family protein/LysM repeat protein